MSNKKVIVEVINKIRNHVKSFTFHNNKGTDHGMVRKAITPGRGVLLNEG